MPTKTSTPPIMVTKELIEQRRRKRAKERQASFGKIGILMIVLVIVVLFTAAHSRKNEMMYVALIFVFIVIALFTYGFWSSVYKGQGVWQYIGKHNLQHQQITNPAYHYEDAKRFKDNPRTKVHVIAPPKMGGVHLQIYTLGDDESSENCTSPRESPVPRSSPSNSLQLSHKSHHHHRRHHHHHHKHRSHHHPHNSHQQIQGHDQEDEKENGNFSQNDKQKTTFLSKNVDFDNENNISNNHSALLADQNNSQT